MSTVKSFLLRILCRLAGATHPGEVAGAYLDETSYWEIADPRKPGVFLRALPALFPDGAYVFFEGTTNGDFADWLHKSKVPEPLRIRLGTVWPKSDCYHVPLTAALMEETACIADRNRIKTPVIHLHVHDGTRVLLSWYDAFAGEPMRISTSVDRDRVIAFADALGGEAPKECTREAASS